MVCPRQAHDAANVQHIHHGAEHAKDKHSLKLCLLQLVAALLERRHLLLLPVEDLGDLDAGQVLGQEGIQLRTGVGDRPVGPAGELLEDDREQGHKGHKAQHHQRQGVVYQKHGPQHARWYRWSHG